MGHELTAVSEGIDGATVRPRPSWRTLTVTVPFGTSRLKKSCTKRPKSSSISRMSMSSSGTPCSGWSLVAPSAIAPSARPRTAPMGPAMAQPAAPPMTFPHHRILRSPALTTSDRAQRRLRGSRAWDEASSDQHARDRVLPVENVEALE